MCLCNGTGGLSIRRSWGVEFAPCPDSNCKFDRNEADRKYNEWRVKVDEYLNQQNNAPAKKRWRDYEVILDDLEFAFDKAQLNEIASMHNEGYWVTDIADEIKRNEYEVLLAIVHLHKRRRLTRELAFRKKRRD